MANAVFSLGTVNITQHLLIIARDASNPSVEFARQQFDPPQPATRNITFNNMNAVTYYFDIRESPDGTALGNLLSTFQYDVKNQYIEAAEYFYLVGGTNPTDPAALQDTLTDTGLNGKTITGVFQEGFRFLIPPSDAVRKEYSLVTGGGIKLLNGNLFQSGQVWRIQISNLVNQSQLQTGSGGYTGVVDIPSATLTLNSSHRSKRLRCEGTSATQVLTLESLSGVPEGTPIGFTSNGGNNYQTRILTQSGDYFKWFDTTYNELWIDQGEFLEIERRIIAGTAYWEVVRAHHAILMVGERFSAQWKDHPNTLPEDGSLYDGDNFPRLWWYIKNRLPVNHFVTDDNVINGGYVRPANKQGQFIIHSTLKKFRMPDTQNLGERGLKSFSAYNTDANRLYDYPGGYQADNFKDHKHVALEMDDTSHSSSSSVTNGTAWALVNGSSAGGVGHVTIPNSKTGTVENGAGTETVGKNNGVIYLRRI